NHLRKTTGAGDDRNSTAPRPSLALTDREHFDHFIEIADLDGAVGAQHFGKNPRFTSKSAGVAGDRTARALAAPDLEDDYGFANRRCAIERGNVAFGLAHGLGEGRDHFGGGVVYQILQVVDGPGDGFIAGRDGETDAEAAKIRQ